MSDVRSQLRAEFTTVFERADFPVTDPFVLIPVLPDGPATEFRAGEVVIPAIELGTTYRDYQEFPCHDVESLVDDIMAGLDAEGTI